VAVSQGAEDHAQKKSLHTAEWDRADVVEVRGAFICRLPELDPDHLAFIDETWATPIWRAAMAGPPAACGYWRQCRTGIGR
jgi:hypothetical protein